MAVDRDRSHGWGIVRLGMLTLAACAPATVGTVAEGASSLRSTAAASLVFDGVTVVDVDKGKLVPGQRVVIVGNRIQTVGAVGVVEMPPGAQVVDARGKYLIPGLWDMHTHAMLQTDFFYPLFLANGITGIRDASSELSLDTLIKLRREILAGSRLGPPRQILSGRAIDGPDSDCVRGRVQALRSHTCVADSADARHLVDSLKTAGADMIKMYDLSKEMYFVIAAEARRVGIPFGGHLGLAKQAERVSTIDASDSGASLIDHVVSSSGMNLLCSGRTASTEQCRPVAERLKRNGTWWVPTLLSFPYLNPGNGWRREKIGPRAEAVLARFDSLAPKFASGVIPDGNWLKGTAGADVADSAPRFFEVAQQVDLPIVAGTDVAALLSTPFDFNPPGFALHAELAVYAAAGLTPLEALRTATLNPAKMLRGTDSLGTVAPGKLADLVLLDADPLADITNTTTIRAVVANGRYYDRAALDRILVEVGAKGLPPSAIPSKGGSGP